MKLFSNLMVDVINPGFCIRCGACVASCPVKVISLKNLPELTGTCINCGICYGSCPEVVRPEVYQRAVFGAPARDQDLGTFIRAVSACSSDPSVKSCAQDGGAVTSLLTSLLESNHIDGTVLVCSGEKLWSPKIKVITDPKEVRRCSGSKYSHAPIFLGLRDAVDLYRRDRLALVGTPCQILALRRMLLSEPANRHLVEAIRLTIGLFCWGVFDYEKFFVNHINKLHMSLSEITKFDIKEGNMLLHTKEGSVAIPLDSIKEHLDLPCSLCSDFTAELADISFGTEGSPDGQTTILIRTKAGEEAFDIAAKSGRIVWSELGEQGIAEIKKAAASKRKRAEETVDAMKKVKRALPVWATEDQQKPYSNNP